MTNGGDNATRKLLVRRYCYEISGELYDADLVLFLCRTISTPFA
jgi:hypothetical protein